MTRRDICLERGGKSATNSGLFFLEARRFRSFGFRCDGWELPGAGLWLATRITSHVSWAVQIIPRCNKLESTRPDVNRIYKYLVGPPTLVFDVL